MRRDAAAPARARPGALRALCAVCALLAAAPPRAAFADPSPGVEVGASLRVRYEVADAAFLGPPVTRPTHVTLTRALTHLSAYGTGGGGVFVQLGWHDEAGRRPGPTPTDVDGIDVQQAYADLQFGDGARLRLGRQEVALGSARLVSVREAPNIRRAFDGIALDLRRDAWSIRLLALAAVTNARGAFDDSSDRDLRLAGVYATRRAEARVPGVDLYALDYRNRHARYASGTGAERRWSFGARLFATQDSLDYNLESILQTGTFGHRTIRAWTIASDTGYTLRTARFRPRFGLKANVTSGDRDPQDGRLGTFNPLFPNLAYFSEAATLAPQNHIDVQLSAALTPATPWTIRLGLDRFWRTTTADAVYRNTGAPYPIVGGSRAVATQATLDVRREFGARAEAKASIVRWTPAAALERAGARDAWFAMLSVALQW